MKLGGLRLHNKPFRTEEPLLTVARALEESSVRRELASLRRSAPEGAPLPDRGTDPPHATSLRRPGAGGPHPGHRPGHRRYGGPRKELVARAHPRSLRPGPAPLRGGELLGPSGEPLWSRSSSVCEGFLHRGRPVPPWTLRGGAGGGPSSWTRSATVSPRHPGEAPPGSPGAEGPAWWEPGNRSLMDFRLVAATNGGSGGGGPGGQFRETSSTG